LNGVNAGVFIGSGNGTFGAESTYSIPGSPYGIVTADFNQDTKPDLALNLVITGKIAILLKC
jgi:hypothetical protein